MPTHALPGRALAVNFSNIAAFAAVAAAWNSAAFNGDTGTISVPNTAGLPKIALEISGAALDDGVIPAGATILTAQVGFDWSATADGANTWSLTSVAAPAAPVTITTNASGHLDSVIVDYVPIGGAPRADFFALVANWEWNLSLTATDGAAHNFRLVITNWAITVTYSLPGVTPATGSTAGGVAVTITGAGFTGAVDGDVTFNGLPATVVNVISDAILTCNTPAHVAGTVDVAVDGFGTLPAAFTYIAGVSLDSVLPKKGPTTGGLAVTLRGVGFTGKTAADVTFGGTAVGSLVIVSDTELTCTPAAHAAGLVAVAVAGCGTLTDAYRYQASAEGSRATITDTDAANLPPIPEPMPPVDASTGKIEGTWLRWLEALKRRSEAIKNVDASTIISGIFQLAQIPTIPWTKIDPTGSSLGDLTTRNASDLDIGTLPDARLRTVNEDVGTFGDATHVAQVTLDDKGRVTAAADVVIALPTGAALTGTDDTNVTAALTGTPATALLRAVNIALGWAGFLSPARGGTGADTSSVAKGGLIVGTAAGTFGVKAVGTDGQVLTADAASAGGVKWWATYDAPMTNGDPNMPEIVFDSNGDVVMVTGIPL